MARTHRQNTPPGPSDHLGGGPARTPGWFRSRSKAVALPATSRSWSGRVSKITIRRRAETRRPRKVTTADEPAEKNPGRTGPGSAPGYFRTIELKTPRVRIRPGRSNSLGASRRRSGSATAGSGRQTIFEGLSDTVIAGIATSLSARWPAGFASTATRPMRRMAQSPKESTREISARMPVEGTRTKPAGWPNHSTGC